jgi:hypothetical protein
LVCLRAFLDPPVVRGPLDVEVHAPHPAVWGIAAGWLEVDSLEWQHFAEAHRGVRE